MIRVLFINHSTIIGGAETNLLNIIRYAPIGGYEPVGVLLPDDGPLAVEVRTLGLPVGLIRYHAFHWRNPLRYAQTMFQLISWIRRTRPAVIHLNHQWLSGHIVQAGIMTRVPVVCHIRNYLDEAFVHAQRRWLIRARAIIVVSKAVQHRALDLGLPKNRIRLIFDGADLRRFQNTQSLLPAKSAEQRGKNGWVVGFSGRIVLEKGPEDLIRAIPLILASVPNVRFCFLGEDRDGGAFIEHLKTMASRLGVGQHVHFLGFRQDVESVLADFDVLVIPSRSSMPEGLPLTALEGLAVGCLVVATVNSGLPEVIRDGETGFLVPPDDPEALAAGIVKVLTLSEGEQRRLKRAGREVVVGQFSIEQQVTRLGQLYREVVS